MKRKVAFLLTAAGVAGAALGAGGLSCDDVSPGTYVPTVRDVEVPEHALSQVEACRACVIEDGGICKMQYDSCTMKDPRCAGYTACLIDSFCWEQIDPTNFGALPPCAAMCFAEAGVQNLNEIIPQAGPGYFCVTDPKKCAPVCTHQLADAGDAGVPDAGAD